MDLDGDALPIVMDGYEPLLLVDLHFEQIHLAVPLVVVRRIDQHFVEYLVKSGHKSDFLVFELGALLGQHPFPRFLHLDGTDVGVWPQQHMFKGCFLLVGLFDRPHP